jgi:hypothetical protein
MKMARKTAESASVVRTSGCVQGTVSPPVLSPTRSNTSAETSVKAPRKSTRFIDGLLVFVTGALTLKKTSRAERNMLAARQLSVDMPQGPSRLQGVACGSGKGVPGLCVDFQG